MVKTKRCLLVAGGILAVFLLFGIVSIGSQVEAEGESTNEQGAEETTGLTKEQRIIQEVADAFYAKSTKTNYHARLTVSPLQPEELTSQKFSYMGCASFVRNVYSEAFELDLDSSQLEEYENKGWGTLMTILSNPNQLASYAKKYWGQPDHSDVVYYYERGQNFNVISNMADYVKPNTDGINDESEKKQLIYQAKLQYLVEHYDLQVGDIIGYTENGSVGHVMLVQDIIEDSDGKKHPIVYHSTSVTDDTHCRTFSSGLSSGYRQSRLNYCLSVNKDLDGNTIYEGTIMIKDLAHAYDSKESAKGDGDKYKVGFVPNGHQYEFIIRPLLERGINGKKEFYSSYCSSITADVLKCGAGKMGYKIPEKSESRLKYPKLYIEKTVDVGNEQIVKQGDTITYRIKLKNNSNENYKDKIRIEETLGEYTKENDKNGKYNLDGKYILDGNDVGEIKAYYCNDNCNDKSHWVSNGTVTKKDNKESMINWEIPLNAGEEKEIIYQVTVNNATGGKNEYHNEIISNGKVDNIPSGEIKNKIGNNFKEGDGELIKDEYDRLKNEGLKGFDLINEVYKNVFQVDLGLDQLKPDENKPAIIGAQYHYYYPNEVNGGRRYYNKNTRGSERTAFTRFDLENNPYYREYDTDRCINVDNSDDCEEINPIVVTRPPITLLWKYSLWLNKRSPFSEYVLANYYNGLHFDYNTDEEGGYKLPIKLVLKLDDAAYVPSAYQPKVDNESNTYPWIYINNTNAANYVDQRLLKDGDILLYSNRDIDVEENGNLIDDSGSGDDDVGLNGEETLSNDSGSSNSCDNVTEGDAKFPTCDKENYLFGKKDENGDYAFIYYKGTFYGSHDDGNNEIPIRGSVMGSKYWKEGDYINDNLEQLIAKDYYVIIRPAMAINKVENVSVVKGSLSDTDYVVNRDHELKLTGGKLKVVYSYGEEELDLSDERITITGFDGSVEGTQELLVKFKDGNDEAQTTFSVEVTSRQVQKIEMGKYPKTQYKQNSEDLDLTGGTIKVIYNDTSTDEISLTNSEVKVTGFSNKTLGTKRILVEYNENLTSFDVEIIANQKPATDNTKPQDTKPQTYPVPNTSAKDNKTTTTGTRPQIASDPNVKRISKIEMKTLPTKLNYTQNKDDLDLTGGSIKVIYNDNSTDEVSLTNNQVSVTGFNNKTIGNKKLIVNYRGFATFFDITVVNDKVISKIEMKKLPLKTTYVQNQEKLDLTGGIIKVFYEDGSIDDISLTNKQITVSGFDNSKLGENVIKVKYGDFETSYKVEILTKQVVRIEIETLPTKNRYIKNKEELDLTGGVLKLIYNDGTTGKVSLTNESVRVSGFDNSQTGKQSLTVKYLGKTIKMEVEVVEETSLLGTIGLIVAGGILILLVIGIIVWRKMKRDGSVGGALVPNYR